MHIGMRLLHPAAADHSVSISRQQVQCIFSFSRWKSGFIILLLTSAGEWFQRVEHAQQENFRAGGTALQLRRFFSCRVDCTHQVALPPVFVVGDHLPCALQHTKRAFSLKKHSRVHLFKCCIWQTRRYISVKTSWVLLQTTCYPCASGMRYLTSGDGHNRCLTCCSWMSHLLIVGRWSSRSCRPGSVTSTKGRSSVASALIWFSFWLQTGEDYFRRWHGWPEDYSGGKPFREPTLEGPSLLLCSETSFLVPGTGRGGSKWPTPRGSWH